jgi:hypothetical protein
MGYGQMYRLQTLASYRFAQDSLADFEIAADGCVNDILELAKSPRLIALLDSKEEQHGSVFDLVTGVKRSGEGRRHS